MIHRVRVWIRVWIEWRTRPDSYPKVLTVPQIGRRQREGGRAVSQGAVAISMFDSKLDGASVEVIVLSTSADALLTVDRS